MHFLHYEPVLKEDADLDRIPFNTSVHPLGESSPKISLENTRSTKSEAPWDVNLATASKCTPVLRRTGTSKVSFAPCRSGTASYINPRFPARQTHNQLLE